MGKNKRLSKGKKGKGKKIVDPFTKKEWYDIKAPGNFSVRNCGKTPVTRTTGTKIASEMLKGRVFEVCLADLNKDEDQHYRKIKLQCEEVQGHSCLTQFYGLTFTTDKLRSAAQPTQPAQSTTVATAHRCAPPSVPPHRASASLPAAAALASPAPLPPPCPPLPPPRASAHRRRPPRPAARW